MMIEVFILTPVIVRLKKEFGEKLFAKIAMILTGFLVLFGVAYLKYQQILHAIELKFRLDAGYSPLPVLASILIFAGFAMLTVKGVFDKLATITFEIYLFHAGIWSLIERILRNRDMDSRIMVPILSILVFLLSIAVSLLYKKIWKLIENKTDITKKVVNWMGLSGGI